MKGEIQMNSDNEKVYNIKLPVTKLVKNIKRIIAGVGSGILAIVLICKSTYICDEQHQVVVTTFGKPTSVTKSGMNFIIPFIQDTKEVTTTVIGMPIGYTEGDNQDVPEECLMITGDYNFVNVDFYYEIQATNPEKVLYNSTEPGIIAKSLAQSVIRSVVASYDVDSVLTTGKSEIQSKILKEIQTELEKLDLGLVCRNITIQDAEPPTDEVKNAFRAVEDAKQSKDTAINQAKEYTNKKIPEAQAKADKIMKDATANKNARIAEAQGQANRFNNLYKEYVNNPEINKTRMYYETMEKVLPGVEAIIDGTNGKNSIILNKSDSKPETTVAAENKDK